MILPMYTRLLYHDSWMSSCEWDCMNHWRGVQVMTIDFVLSMRLLMSMFFLWLWNHDGVVMMLKVSLSSHGQTNHAWINLYYVQPSSSFSSNSESPKAHLNTVCMCMWRLKPLEQVCGFTPVRWLVSCWLGQLSKPQQPIMDDEPTRLLEPKPSSIHVGKISPILN